MHVDINSASVVSLAILEPNNIMFKCMCCVSLGKVTSQAEVSVKEGLQFPR